MDGPRDPGPPLSFTEFFGAENPEAVERPAREVRASPSRSPVSMEARISRQATPISFELTPCSVLKPSSLPSSYLTAALEWTNRRLRHPGIAVRRRGNRMPDDRTNTVPSLSPINASRGARAYEKITGARDIADWPYLRASMMAFGAGDGTSSRRSRRRAERARTVLFERGGRGEDRMAVVLRRHGRPEHPRPDREARDAPREDRRVAWCDRRS